MSDRPSWHQYFLTITRQVAERSTCTRAKVGALTGFRPTVTLDQILQSVIEYYSGRQNN